MNARRLVHVWSRIPWIGQVILAAWVATLMLPWLLRGYAWWWDLAWGRTGTFVETIMPRVVAP